MMKIGIFGSGQLGKMLTQAAQKLGHTVHIYAPKSGCACDVAPEFTQAPWDDQIALKKFYEDVDVVTYELEQLPLVVFENLPDNLKVYPNIEALKISQNRVLEKTYSQNLGIPVAQFHKLESKVDLDSIANNFSFPLILKTNEGGYDGKGQKRIPSFDELKATFEKWQCDCIVEAIVNWEREVSLIASRAPNGDIVYFSPIENYHADGILRWSLSPCAIDQAQTNVLRGYVKHLLDKLDYVGTIAVEFFQTSEGFILNEIAPRVHNSGHLTIEGTIANQFENHIRAITGMDLKDPQARNTAVMYNLISLIPTPLPNGDAPNATLHDYKKSPNPGRKLGHMTFTFENLETAQTHIEHFHQQFITDPKNPT